MTDQETKKSTAQQLHECVYLLWANTHWLVSIDKDTGYRTLFHNDGRPYTANDFDELTADIRYAFGRPTINKDLLNDAIYRNQIARHAEKEDPVKFRYNFNPAIEWILGYAEKAKTSHIDEFYWRDWLGKVFKVKPEDAQNMLVIGHDILADLVDYILDEKENPTKESPCIIGSASVGKSYFIKNIFPENLRHLYGSVAYSDSYMNFVPKIRKFYLLEHAEYAGVNDQNFPSWLDYCTMSVIPYDAKHSNTTSHFRVKSTPIITANYDSAALNKMIVKDGAKARMIVLNVERHTERPGDIFEKIRNDVFISFMKCRMNGNVVRPDIDWEASFKTIDNLAHDYKDLQESLDELIRQEGWKPGTKKLMADFRKLVVNSKDHDLWKKKSARKMGGSIDYTIKHVLQLNNYAEHRTPSGNLKYVIPDRVSSNISTEDEQIINNLTFNEMSV